MLNYPEIPDDLYITSEITGEIGEDGSYETGFDKYWYDFKPIMKIAETCPTDIGTKMIKLAKEDMKKKLPEGEEHKSLFDLQIKTVHIGYVLNLIQVCPESSRRLRTITSRENLSSTNAQW